MNDTAQYKTKLEEELKTLTEELKTIGIHDPENTQNWVESGADLNTRAADPLDVADRTEEYDERRATVAVLETRYNNIVLALKKIEEGTYGVCEVSGEPISPERLDANPAARTCAAHMEK